MITLKTPRFESLRTASFFLFFLLLVLIFKYLFFRYLIRSAGWEPPLEPVELRPLPVAFSYGHGGAMKQEAPPSKAG
jgi:hypothetical protein